MFVLTTVTEVRVIYLLQLKTLDQYEWIVIHLLQLKTLDQAH